MSDQPPIPEKKEAEGIQVDAQGDPLRQGTLMIERESYERVIEGLKIASDAAAHLAKYETGKAWEVWRKLANNLDQVRRIAVQKAGLGLAMKERETTEVRGEPMPWRRAKDRFREGLIQAAGGMRQMATCFRGDFAWSRMATDLEQLDAKMRGATTRVPTLNGGLILPPGYN